MNLQWFSDLSEKGMSFFAGNAYASVKLAVLSFAYPQWANDLCQWAIHDAAPLASDWAHTAVEVVLHLHTS